MLLLGKIYLRVWFFSPFFYILASDLRFSAVLGLFSVFLLCSSDMCLLSPPVLSQRVLTGTSKPRHAPAKLPLVCPFVSAELNRGHWRGLADISVLNNVKPMFRCRQLGMLGNWLSGIGCRHSEDEAFSFNS